jgi:outer membrane biosynthesis protein TonB
MKQFVTLLWIALCTTATLHAQTFTEHIQKKVQGQGTVTVSQSKEIDELVNGAKKPQPEKTTTTTKPATHQNKTNKVAPVTKPVKHEETAKKQEHKETTKKIEEPRHNESDSAKKEKKTETTTPKVTETDTEDNEMEIPVVDMRKKVMRGSHKVNGYRVQVFAGGNSRNDKIRAEQAGEKIKMAFPDQPVYVHFYSPSWKCRVGNFRSYEEAHRILLQVKKMGYRQAIILSGKITVQY